MSAEDTISKFSLESIINTSSLGRSTKVRFGGISSLEESLSLDPFFSRRSSRRGRRRFSSGLPI